MALYGEVAWVQNVRAAGGRARVKSRGREETVRLQEVKPAEADKHPVFEIVTG
jgi:hypothetical protein